MKISKNKIVLITSPSLELACNVSGIASVVRGIVEASKGSTGSFGWKIVLATIGKRDDQGRGVGWALSQIILPVRFAWTLLHQRPHIIHINGPLNSLAIFRDLALLTLSRIYTKNVIYHVHGGAYVHALPNSDLLHRCIKHLLHNTAAIIVLGAREADSLERLYGTNHTQMKVLVNAVTLSPEILSRRPEGPLRVLSMGRLSPEKGLSILCETFERYSNLNKLIELRLYGTGPLEENIIPRLQKALGKSFLFGGIAGPEERDLAYSWADVVVMPSLHGEGLPMVLLEAMAAGVVPIATSDGSITDALRHGENGLIIEKNSSESLAQALDIAISMKSSDTLKVFSTQARAHISLNHSANDYAEKLDNIYTNIFR